MIQSLMELCPVIIWDERTALVPGYCDRPACIRPLCLPKGMTADPSCLPAGALDAWRRMSCPDSLKVWQQTSYGHGLPPGRALSGGEEIL